MALWRPRLPRFGRDRAEGCDSCLAQRAARPRSWALSCGRARVAAGFASQEELAARLGYDRTVIAKAETGERPPTPDVADALEAELFAGGPSGPFGRLAALAAARRAGPGVVPGLARRA